MDLYCCLLDFNQDGLLETSRLKKLILLLLLYNTHVTTELNGINFLVEGNKSSAGESLGDWLD